MSHRIRRSGAILSLIALSAFFAESVWAAACAPDMDMAAVMTADAGEDVAAMTMTPHMHMPMPADGTQPAEQGSDPCPLVAATGGCVSSSLASAGTAPAFAPFESALTPPAPVSHIDLFVGTTLFHPPRA